MTGIHLHNQSRYNGNLVEARDLGIRKGLVNGISLGSVWMIVFLAYALGFWYGAKLAREEADTYTIGNVMIVSHLLFLTNL